MKSLKISTFSSIYLPKLLEKFQKKKPKDVTFIKNQKNDYKEVDVKDLEDADLWPMRSVTNQM